MQPFAVFALALAVATSTASAQTAPDDRKQRAIDEAKRRFADADANHDGKLTREEAAGKMPRVYEHFDEIDKNKQGFVTLEDIRAYSAGRRAEKKAARPEP